MAMEIGDQISAQLKLLNFKSDGSDLTFLSNSSIASLNLGWEALLIAKFLPAQPSNVSHAALVSAVRRAFGLRSKHDFDLLRYNSERYIIKFRHFLDFERARYREPIIIFDSTLITKVWDGDQNVEDVILDGFNCWVQVHADKQHLLTEEVAKEFFSEVGCPIPICGKKNFFFEFGKARAYLGISSRKPLVTLGARRFFDALSASHVIIMGSIKFEKIKSVCFICGLLDHILEDCPNKCLHNNNWKSQHNISEFNSLWGDWIFAPKWYCANSHTNTTGIDHKNTSIECLAIKDTNLQAKEVNVSINDEQPFQDCDDDFPFSIFDF